MWPGKAEKRERPFSHTSSSGLRSGSVCPHGRGAIAVQKDTGEHTGQPQEPVAVEVSLLMPVPWFRAALLSLTASRKRSLPVSPESTGPNSAAPHGPASASSAPQRADGER